MERAGKSTHIFEIELEYISGKAAKNDNINQSNFLYTNELNIMEKIIYNNTCNMNNAEI